MNDLRQTAQDDQATKRKHQVLEVILAYRPTFSRSTTGEPMVSVPIADVPGATKSLAPVDSDLVRGELSVIVMESLRWPLRCHETNEIIQLFTGLAYREPIPEPSISQLLDDHPWIEAMLAYLATPEQEGTFRGTATALLEGINKIRVRGAAVPRNIRWPSHFSVLGVWIRKHEQDLLAVGVELTIEPRKSGVRTISLSMINQEKSVEPTCGSEVTANLSFKNTADDQSIIGNDADDSFFKVDFSEIALHPKGKP